MPQLFYNLLVCENGKKLILKTMKKLFTTFKTLMLGGLMLSSVVAGAQQVPGRTGAYPLTSDRQYTYGIAPDNANQTDAVNAYNAWKQTYVATDCGNARVIFDFYPGGLGATDRSETVSEGIAYGMLLSAYAGDRSLFDGLWAYYKGHRNGNGVMNWKIKNCNNVVGANGASDAELDAAMALIVASYQWQNDNYLSDAKNMIRIIREKEFEGSILKPGDQFGGQSLTNPSYFSPAYYEVFKQFDGNTSFWNNAITKGYQIIDAADKNDLGLVPDWTDGSGNTTGAASQYKDGGKNFFFDAVRTPFRSAIDYLWHGRAEGKAYCEKLINWSNGAHNGGTEQLQSYYKIDGTPLGNGHSNTFVGCFSVAAMATSNQSYLNRGYADNQNTNPTSGQYFNATFKVLANFVMSGNFYLPPPDACDGPSLGNDKSLCSGPTASLDAGVTANSYEWRRNGIKIPNATAKTYNATLAGEYEVITNQDGCVRRDKIQVYPDLLVADFSFTVGPGVVFLENTTQGGVSSSTWNDGSDDFSTDLDADYEYTGEGAVDITLTVTNSGFVGCSDTETETKTIILGGNGWSADDFNVTANVTTWIGGDVKNPDGSSEGFTALPKVRCSADAVGADCPGNPCGLFKVVAKATAGQYNPFGVDFNEGQTLAGDPIITPVDIDAVPFVSMRIRSSVDVSIGIGLNGKRLEGPEAVTTERVKVDLVGGEWTVIPASVLDFNLNRNGYLNALNPSVEVDFTQIKSVQIFPFQYPLAALPAGESIEVDWIVVGSKSLEAPSFDIKRDANNLAIYEDPDGDEIYTTVSSWLPEVTSCGEETILKANSCTATDIRWFNGDVQFETGSEVEVGPGTYRVQLVNEGGTTTAEVTVKASDINADFVIERTNYDATFINKSTGFDTFEWHYGDPENDADPLSTTWDIGYHGYRTAGDGEYTVSLTVTDTICDVTDTEVKQLLIACDMLTGAITLVDSTVKGCAGDEVMFAIEAVENAQSYGWYGPEGTDIVLAEDSLSATVTFGSVDGPLTIKAFNSCSEEPTSHESSKEIALDLAGIPVGTFEMAANTGGGFVLEADADAVASDEATYAWSFGDGESGTGASVEHTYAASLENIAQTVCLTVTNRCASSEEECDEFTPTAPVGFFTLNEQNVSMFPTATTNSLTVELSGKANVTISDVLGNTVSQSVVTDKGTINVADLSAGMYILSIKQGSEVVNKRFIKE